MAPSDSPPDEERDMAPWVSRMRSAALIGDEAAMREALAAGVDPDTPLANPFGSDRALGVAVSRNFMGCLNALIQAGADLDERQERGWTHAMRAAADRRVEPLRALALAGADLEARGENGLSAMASASISDAVECLAVLIEAGADIEAQGLGERWRPLMHAANRGSIKCLGALLDAGADPDAQSASGLTAAMFAARKGHLDGLMRLIAAGANLDIQNFDGKTALMAAAERGKPDTLLALLDAGADRELRNSEGQTALDIARAEETSCAAILEAIAEARGLRASVAPSKEGSKAPKSL